MKISSLSSYKYLLNARKLAFKNDNFLLQKSLEEIKKEYTKNKNVILCK
jgi:hypothetical protein